MNKKQRKECIDAMLNARSNLNPDFVYVPMSKDDIAEIAIAFKFDMPKPINEICHVDVLTGELMPSYPTEDELAVIGCRMVDNRALDILAIDGECVEVK